MSTTISKIGFVLCLLCIAFGGAAIELQGTGIAKDVETAKTLALKDLASGIEIRIVAAANASEGYYKDDRVESYAVDIDTDAVSIVDIPIYGAEFTTSPKNERGEYSVKVSVSSDKAIPLYLSKIEELTAELFAVNEVQLTQKGMQREESLKQLFAGVKLFKKYRSMLMVLEYRPLPEPPFSELLVKAEIRTLQNSLNTIPKAAAYLAKDIKQAKIYVFPPAASSSSEVTDFASIMQGALNAELYAVMSPSLADYIFKGFYRVGTEGMDISYSLIPIKGNDAGTIIASANARILEEAYAGMNYEPTAFNVEKLIKEGLAVAADFTISATTSQGKYNLLFREDDHVELLVKLNTPGYFYGLCHVDGADGKFSHLLDLNKEVSGKRRFVFYVSPDDVNKWIVLGKFKTSITNGVERIQFMASTDDPVNNIPETKFENGLHIVTGESRSGSQDDNAVSDETSIIYTVVK